MLAQPVTTSANAEIPIHRNPFIEPPRDTFVSSLRIPLLLSLDSTRVIAAMARRVDLPSGGQDDFSQEKNDVPTIR